MSSHSPTLELVKVRLYPPSRVGRSACGADAPACVACTASPYPAASVATATTTAASPGLRPLIRSSIEGPWSACQTEHSSRSADPLGLLTLRALKLFVAVRPRKAPDISSPFTVASKPPWGFDGTDRVRRSPLSVPFTATPTWSPWRPP